MSKVKKPGWVTAVSIIAIVLGGFGAMGGMQEAMSPLMIEQQKIQYEEMEREFAPLMEQLSADDDPTAQKFLGYFTKFMDMFKQYLNMPDWYMNWLIISGILSMAINAFYLYAAVLLMQLKPQSIRYLYIALPLSIALGFTRTYFAYAAFEDMASWIMGGTMIAIVIEIILLLIIIKADKAPYRQFEA